MDGVPLHADRYSLSDTLLTVHNVPEEFVLETKCEIHPEENKSLEGLYRSGNVFCTQNEPRGSGASHGSSTGPM
jgi:aminopeptidase N